jgi:cytochrome c oxidase subunit 2
VKAHLGPGRSWAAVVILAVCLIASGCTGEYNPQSKQAHDIDGLWWVMLWLAVAVFIVVIGFAAYALFHRRGGSSTMEKSRSQFLFLFLGGAFVPLLILAAVFGYSLDVTRDSGADQPNQLLIHVTGHQWWYQVDYPQQKISSRNVMHIPEHRQVKIILTSADVIHSFWVPELNGKTDIIPGVTNQLFITGAQAGAYIGHCAEFCGIGHTTMLITVIVEPQSTFNKWVASQKGA